MRRRNMEGRGRRMRRRKDEPRAMPGNGIVLPNGGILGKDSD
jgi:hypothetical protein